ncbi:MAG: phenylacetate--CoA ligase family protein [Thermoguttaceae bacterium]
MPILARTFFRLQERLLGRPTFRLLAELEQSQWWPRERLEALQFERLRAMLGAAYAYSPYWWQVMDRAGVRPGAINTLADLRRLPLLEKETIRTRRDEMVCRAGTGRIWLGRTGGSTATPIEFYTSALREAHISAARMRGHAWVGMQRGEREMYFWGSPVERGKQDAVKSIRDWLINDGFTDGFNVTEADVPGLVAAWRRFRPKCIFCYPSSMALVVRMARRQGIDLRSVCEAGLQMIITTAEILGPMREEISEAFDVPVYDSYGLREAALVAHECSRQTLHATEEQLILETIDPATLEPTEGEGELVVTSLISDVMPMIRYRTGDVVSLDDAPCSCGRTLRGLRVTGGRGVDFVVTSRGAWVSGYVFVYLMKEVPGIVKLQVQQERIGHVRLLVVPDARTCGSALAATTKSRCAKWPTFPPPPRASSAWL